MNFLGHLSLAWPDRELMVGGFLGDFVKGPLKGALPTKIEAGIRLHRRIDARSDIHASIAELRLELPKPWARYTGILADLYCDHLISDSTNNLLNQPTSAFADDCHLVLDQYREYFSERANLVFERMCQGRWLERYADIQFTANSLERIGQRMKFENPLADSAKIFEQHATPLDRCCRTLYTGMQEVVAEWLEEAPAN